MASGQPSTLSFVDFGRGPLVRLVGFFLYATGEETFGEDLRFLAGLVSDGRLRVEAGCPGTGLGPRRRWRLCGSGRLRARSSSPSGEARGKPHCRASWVGPAEVPVRPRGEG
jgi:hypothetical protein